MHPALVTYPARAKYRCLDTATYPALDMPPVLVTYPAKYWYQDKATYPAPGTYPAPAMYPLHLHKITLS